MVEKIVAIKEKSTALYYMVLVVLAIPILGLVFVSVVSPAIRGYLVNSAKRLLESSKKKDQEISDKIKQTDVEIAKNQGKIEAIDQQIAVVDNSEDLNWHKNWKK